MRYNLLQGFRSRIPHAWRRSSARRDVQLSLDGIVGLQPGAHSQLDGSEGVKQKLKCLSRVGKGNPRPSKGRLERAREVSNPCEIAIPIKRIY